MRGGFEIIDLKTTKRIFAFMRESDDEKVIVVFNFSGKGVKFKLKDKETEGNYFDYFTSHAFDANNQIELQPFGYLVLIEEF